VREIHLLLESWARVLVATACTTWGAWFLFGRWGAGIVLMLVGLMFFAGHSMASHALAKRRALNEARERQREGDDS